MMPVFNDEKPRIKLVTVDLVGGAEEPEIYIVDSEAAARHAAEYIGNKPCEVIMAINMAQDGRAYNATVCTVGTVNEVGATASDVFRAAILSNATRMIIAHNHPAGSMFPSADDDAFTRRFAECGRLLGINVDDHIIIGRKPGEYFSYSESKPGFLAAQPGAPSTHGDPLAEYSKQVRKAADFNESYGVQGIPFY